jgi:hypothetical protein
VKFLAYRGTFKRLQGGVSAIFSPRSRPLTGRNSELTGRGERRRRGLCVCETTGDGYGYGRDGGVCVCD